MTISISKLQAMRGKMTPLPWRASNDTIAGDCDHASGRPVSVVDMMSGESMHTLDASGIVATHNVADTLIEIVLAALAWRAAVFDADADYKVIDAACEALMSTMVQP